jgi:hypothetical protein
MHTSWGTALRALLLLACMIAMPLVALWGSSLPTMLSLAMEGQWSKIIGMTRGNRNAGEIAQFAPSNPLAFGSSASGAERASPPRQADRAPTDVKTHPQAKELSPSQVIPVMYQVPAGRVSTGDNPAAKALAADERFIQMHDKLRQLGCTYILLESWGNDNNLFRFCCTLNLGGNARFVRQFQGTDSEPLRAMAQVLRQVEQCSGGK